MNHDAYERRCRTLLRAYPPRYRQSRQDELLGTLLDAAPADRDTPTLRDSWDVLRGGLQFRLHDRPPLHWWLAYHVLQKRLPYRYRWWARDDILGRYHFLRGFLVRFILLSPVLFAEYVFNAPTFVQVENPIIWILIPLVERKLGLFDRRRKKMLAKHEFNPDGTPWQSPPWPSVPVLPPPQPSPWSSP